MITINNFKQEVYTAMNTKMLFSPSDGIGNSEKENKCYTIRREEIARENFKGGCNCAQAVLLAFPDITSLDRHTAMKLASPFGGGMGRMREVCGAVSGALMVIGFFCGYDADSDKESGEKALLYSRVQEFSERFRNENGSIICRELLSGQIKRIEAGASTSAEETDTQIGAMLSSSPIPTPRSDEYYKKRPCAELVVSAARILAELTEEWK